MKERKVKKLYSIDPVRYRYITEEEALKGYIKYLERYIADLERLDLDPEDVKDYQLWIDTEI